MPDLDLLVLADLHWRPECEQHPQLPERITGWGPLLALKALQRLRHEGVDPDLIVVLGDSLDDNDEGQSDDALRELLAELRKIGLPILAIPGNHDGSPERFIHAGGAAPGLHEFGGYGFLVFHDRIGEGDVTTRSADALALPRRIAAEQPGLPLVALQHNPLHPAIASNYPFLPANAGDILQGYADAGVILSLSGHYHAGQSAHEARGVLCHTVAAACEAPFRLSHIRLSGREARVTEHCLELPRLGLWDIHCHTQFAYCATTVAAPRSLEIARRLGLGGVSLTEHAFQLYFASEPAWSFAWQSDPRLLQEARRTGRGRMPGYRAWVRNLRQSRVAVGSLGLCFGIETDLCDDGSLLLAEEDAAGWDLLLGGVHAIPGAADRALPPARAEAAFLRHTERLLATPIQALAHPLRWFQRRGQEIPADMPAAVARMLAASGKVCEINFHGTPTDRRLVEECLARGVRLALGSDSHAMAEVGDLWPHLRLLREVGIRDEDLPKALWKPQATP